MDASGEQPREHAVSVEAREISHSSGQAVWVIVEAFVAVQQVLEHVVVGVTEVRFGVDHEPRFAFGGEHVAGVKVGAQQHVPIGGGGQGP